MKMPDCPDGRDDCRFRFEGGMSTAMHSPIVYDRSGAPVGGGCNTLDQFMFCIACNRRFRASGTELEFAQGKEAYSVIGETK